MIGTMATVRRVTYPIIAFGARPLAVASLPPISSVGVAAPEYAPLASPLS